jgi:hypothetical protein
MAWNAEVETVYLVLGLGRNDRTGIYELVEIVIIVRCNGRINIGPFISVAIV